MARFFNNQKEIEELSKQWELHLSGFNKPIQFINNQKPPYYYSTAYKKELFNGAVEKSIECFVVGC